MNWPALPFVRLILPLGLGVFIGTRHFPSPALPIILFINLLSIIFLVVLSAQRLSYRRRKLFGVILSGTIFLLGFLLAFFQTPWNHPHHIRHSNKDILHWYFHIDQIKNGETSIRLEGHVTAIADSTGDIQPGNGQLLLYLSPDSLASSLVPGDQLLVNAPFQPLVAPKNPKAFDFAGFMAKKGIYHRAFANPEAWIKAGHRVTFQQAQLDRLRQYCLQVLSFHLPGTNEFSIGAALIMGQRTLVNDEIREAYTNTGAIHVLAVSGLHVGLIYMGLAWICSLIGWKGHAGRWSRSFVLLAGIWGFAIFTGGSASVLRAAGMFSFVIAGEALYRQHNIYNTLAASAFLLLCIQPGLLLDIGFQLSYLAVIGIVFFQGRIYRSWYIENRWGDFLWKLASVSMAAQLTTLPISLFYFHQFPLYFWLSGWVVVPAAMIILVLGLSLLLLSKVAVIAPVLGTLLYGVIWLMNLLILQIQQLPAGLINGVWLSPGIVGILYFTVISIMSGLSKKRLGPIQMGLIGLILVGSWSNWTLWHDRHQQILSFYHLYGHSAIDYFDGFQAYCISDLPADHPKLEMAAENFRAYHHIQQVHQQSFRDTSFQDAGFFRKGNFLQLGNTILALIDHLPECAPPQPIALDYILLHHNPKISINDLDPFFTAKTIVFDASNSKYRVEAWKKDCITQNRLYHDLEQQGALLVNLKK